MANINRTLPGQQPTSLMDALQPSKTSSAVAPTDPGGSPAGSAAGGGAPSATPDAAPSAPTPGQGGGPEMSGQGTGFVNLQNLLSANQGGAQGMADTLLQNGKDLAASQGASPAAPSGIPKPSLPNTSSARTRSNAVSIQGTSATPGQANPVGQAQAGSYTNNLQSVPGLQANLTQQYGGKGEGYGSGQSLLDALLARGAGQGQFADLQKQFNAPPPAAPAPSAPATQAPEWMSSPYYHPDMPATSSPSATAQQKLKFKAR